MAELENLRAEIEALKRQHNSLADQICEIRELLDTVCSFPLKRIWWFICGWRFYRLGRWYGN